MPVISGRPRDAHDPRGSPPSISSEPRRHDLTDVISASNEAPRIPQPSPRTTTRRSADNAFTWCPSWKAVNFRLVSRSCRSFRPTRHSRRRPRRRRCRDGLRSDRLMRQLESSRHLQRPFLSRRSAVAERTFVDLSWVLRPTSCANTALPGGVGRQDPAEQVQVKDQRGNEYQAPPVSRRAEHNNDDGDPACQQ